LLDTSNIQFSSTFFFFFPNFQLTFSILLLYGFKEQGNEVFMKWECCNLSIQQSKTTMPIIFILGIALIWYLRKKGLEKEGSYNSPWY